MSSPPLSSRFSLITLALALLGVAALSGCGYTADTDDPAGAPGSTGYTADSVFPAGIHSVAVPIFENKTLSTGVERDVTDALIKEIQLRTPYFVTAEDKADSVLTGTIVGVEKTRLNQARGTGLVREMVLSVTVDFEWKDRRTGKTIVARRNFEAGDEYVPSAPFGERPDIGQFGAASDLAREIVAAMRDQW